MDKQPAPKPIPTPSPLLVARVIAKRALPEEHRCPRCKIVWSLDQYRPDFADFPASRIAARCKKCRVGLNTFLRDRARATGLCERRKCNERQFEGFRCASHQPPNRERTDLDLQDYVDAA